jgi:hypothetical protein
MLTVVLCLHSKGSMPTDGTIFLENCPTKYQYIVITLLSFNNSSRIVTDWRHGFTLPFQLTGLSVFFNVGAIISSILGLVLIPSHSCPEHAPPEAICDVATENTGWRLMLRSVSALVRKSSNPSPQSVEDLL